jgi:hypothetical protein
MRGASFWAQLRIIEHVEQLNNIYFQNMQNMKPLHIAIKHKTK